MFCTYLTVFIIDGIKYRYLGSSSISKIQSGYYGSITSKKWKNKINRAFKIRTRMLKKFKTRDEALAEELKLHKIYNVVKSETYINESEARVNGCFGRDVSGTNNPMYGSIRKGEKHIGGENISAGLKLFFDSERGAIEKEARAERLMGENNPMFGKKHSEETIAKMSDKHKGENNSMYGKQHSKESREKISLSKLGKASPNKGKKCPKNKKKSYAVAENLSLISLVTNI